jgi:hypothetical protein
MQPRHLGPARPAGPGRAAPSAQVQLVMRGARVQVDGPRGALWLHFKLAGGSEVARASGSLALAGWGMPAT